MNDTPHDEATEAEWLYEHREELAGQFEDSEEPQVEIASPLTITTSFRMSQDEAALIRQAAHESGLSQSEWIRSVCVASTQHRQPATAGISELDARRLRGLLEQAEEIVRPASRAS